MADATPRLAVLASGRGSNLQAILDAIDDGRLHAQVAGVFGDKPAAFALARARAAGIPARALRPRDFAGRDEFDAALFAEVASVRPDVVVCAGYMRLLGAAALAPWAGRIINIHPSLLPDFKGLDTHARALAAGVPEHGASVHFVTADLDGGPVIAQARVPVLDGDDADALAARVLDTEHPLLVASLQLLCAGRIVLRDEVVELDGKLLAAPLQLASNRLPA
ncbi:phosphoribosylglycinamide formyltransferase [Luteimonas sp. Sa2BVA3]|uniref:Phosphoribosylglycinamide formyltransferase n=1 Tax=Luteimonas colneyensis TaxID=2762230 RepID=A0ABR8UKV2_9GAMM|nr:phosphoribosylglycinamide formyltransferase [Luteimonas colneyensis]MBD7988653.1 phosphoribosylglycinamide formyltransferase [Luteimonas colneyensis]